MDRERLRHLLGELQKGSLSIEEVMDQMRMLPFEALDQHIHIDHQRSLHTGFPEVVFGEGKTPDQLVKIFLSLQERSDRVLATRVSEETYALIQDRLPDAVFHATARCLYFDRETGSPKHPGILVVTGGTADVAVAEEAAITAELMGNLVERIFDVGVAGLHRLINYLPQIQKAKVIVVVAGMEGALPSVVGGLVSAPIIAVPTSVGYGSSFHGLAALLGMLNSCAAGVAVVNIDNGFGAGCMAARINRLSYLRENEKPD